jgi:hypothetical protein
MRRVKRCVSPAGFTVSKTKENALLRTNITLEEANAIATVLELLALVYDIIDDDDNSLSPHYKKQAKLLLEMVSLC